MASAAFVGSALGSAPAASGSCVSFWGLGNGGGCTSTFGGVAIAIGTNSTAVAAGFLTTAISVGTGALAEAIGTFNFASANGTNSVAIAGNEQGTDIAMTAMTIGDNSGAGAAYLDGGGFGNMATNIGTGNVVNSLGNLNTAYALFSTNTEVTASPGPLATAGSIGQTNATVIKKGPGLNINGDSIGGAAAPTNAGARVHSASALHKTTTGKAAPAAGSKKKAGSAAAAKHTSTK